MTHARRYLRAPRHVALLLAVVLGVAGCTDTFLQPDAPEPETTVRATATFRNTHLMERALTQTGKTSALGLVFKVKDHVLDKHRVLERYKAMDRYRVMERYEYDEVFRGYAIQVMDSLGLADFNVLINLLLTDPDILWFEPDFKIKDPKQNGRQGQNPDELPWGLVAIGGAEIDKREVEDMLIYVVDTGTANEDLKVEERFDVAKNLQRDKHDYDDADGHGTHVAGIIGGKKVAEGVIPHADLLSLKIANDDGTIDLSTAIAAVERITTRKIQNPAIPTIVNFSLGANVETDETVSLDEAVAASLQAGVVYVVSAGNDQTDVRHISPARVPGAITVGAYDQGRAFAPFSNYGAGVDILAPGVDIPSLDLDPEDDHRPPVEMSGTSMATAYVTGAAALFLNLNPQARPDQVEAAIVETGRPWITGAPAGTTNKTLFIGSGGLLNLLLPPFLHYAVLSDRDIVFEAPTTIGYAGPEAVNANVFSNSKVELKRADVVVEGFGYARSEVKPDVWADLAFQPRFNPTGVGVQYDGVEEIYIPEFKPEVVQHVATRVTDKVELAGHYDLGTEEDPLVWYIDGDMKTIADVTFSGHGVLLVKNSIEFKHRVTTVGGPDDTRILFFTGGDFKVKKDAPAIRLVGQIVADGSVEVETTFDLTGSILAGGNVRFKLGTNGTTTLRYRPPSPTLTALVWMMEPRLYEGRPAAPGYRLLSRF